MKKGKNAKVGIIVALLLLVVGFAAVSATLYFNGTATLKGNADEFDKNLRFVADTDEAKKATIVSSLDKEGTVSVSTDGKTLTFTTPVLDVVNETVTVNYYVENRGQYDAKFTGISCKTTADNEELLPYIVVTPSESLVGTTLAAMSGTTPTQTEEAATIEVKLNKTYSSDEEATVTITCELKADAE